MRRIGLSALACVLACLATGCGGGDDSGAPAANLAEGARLFEANHCTNCHEDPDADGRFAPRIRGLAELWSRADLAEYLRDPVGFADKSERLVRLEQDYARNMPPYAVLTAEERGALADWMRAEP